MTSADFCVFSNTLQYWLLLSERITQTSPGTTRFLLSIHLPHLSCMIPCSYGALTCSAALPSCITSYVISVRQTRDLPMSSYIPHIQLPSDSTSRWTPLPSAISFPLPGGLGTCTLWKRAPPGAHSKRSIRFPTDAPNFFLSPQQTLLLPLVLHNQNTAAGACSSPSSTAVPAITSRPEPTPPPLC